MPSKKPFRVSTHDLVKHPACKAHREKLYGGPRGVVTTRKIPSTLVDGTFVLPSRKERHSPRTIAEAVRQTGHDYNVFYTYFNQLKEWSEDKPRREPDYRKTVITAHHAEMQEISNRYSGDRTLRTKLMEIEDAYPTLRKK